MSDDLETYESNTHVFMFKIWLEERAEGCRKAKWRGYIIHLLSGSKQYINDFNDVIHFTFPYLENLNIRIGWYWRLPGWLKQKKKKLFIGYHANNDDTKDFKADS